MLNKWWEVHLSNVSTCCFQYFQTRLGASSSLSNSTGALRRELELAALSGSAAPAKLLVLALARHLSGPLNVLSQNVTNIIKYMYIYPILDMIRPQSNLEATFCIFAKASSGLIYEEMSPKNCNLGSSTWRWDRHQYEPALKCFFLQGKATASQHVSVPTCIQATTFVLLHALFVKFVDAGLALEQNWLVSYIIRRIHLRLCAVYLSHLNRPPQSAPYHPRLNMSKSSLHLLHQTHLDAQNPMHPSPSS